MLNFFCARNGNEQALLDNVVPCILHVVVGRLERQRLPPRFTTTSSYAPIGTHVIGRSQSRLQFLRRVTSVDIITVKVGSN